MLVGLVLFLAGTAVSWSWLRVAGWPHLVFRTAGLGFLGAAVVVARRPESVRLGLLLAMTGATWQIADFRTVDQPAVFATAFVLAYLPLAALAHVAFAIPTGRIRSASERALVVTAYVCAVLTQAVRYLLDNPHPPWYATLPQPNTAAAKAGSALAVGLTLAAAWLLVRRLHNKDSANFRRPSVLVGAIFTVTAVLWLVTEAASIMSLPTPWQARLTLASQVTAGTVPLLILVWAGHDRWANARFDRLLREIEASADPGRLRASIARALGDRGLRLAFPGPDGSLVDAEGKALGTEDNGMEAVTPIRMHGQDLAAIVHDGALLRRRRLLHAVGAVAALAIDNARLVALQEAQLEELRESRRRLAAATDAERRRIERDLHDGAQQRLLAVLVMLDEAAAVTGDGTEAGRQVLARARRELNGAVRELLELAHGIYPRILLDHGLSGGLEMLADRSPVPMTYTVDDQRWAREVEITAYFVVSEALSNAYKHADANQVRVRLATTPNGLEVVIDDDGCGGARIADGTGLRSLADRVAAIGGTLTITSTTGAGTTVTALLPGTST